MDWLDKVHTEVQDEIDYETAHPQPKVDHTPNDLDEPAKLLLKAAALMEKFGFNQFALCEDPYGAGGAVCVRGALNLAATGCATSWGDGWTAGSPHHEAEKRFAKALGVEPHATVPGTGVPAWNNAQGRTKTEVVSKLRAVALGL